MPLISVVVPIYNVEPYLRACLDSILHQTVTDLEVILVDDGSTDRSREIAQDYAARDPRFRLITQANAGLGAARNAGAAAAAGEYLAFVDSDDVLPENAYQLLLEPLQRTGSDFATGNVHRLTLGGTAQSPFLARTFAETRWKTHVTEFRSLITDRIVPNKLWRRSFWEEQGFRFPEGMLHEDIPVVVPAQFAARSVDVVKDPVYLYRVRFGADRSITQRRAEQRALLDRLAAIESARRWLVQHGPSVAPDWYDRSVVADDLSYYVDVLDIADDDYRSLFLERVNALLDQASDDIYGGLPAIDRLKWHLVRRGKMPELLEVLRFERERLNHTPPVRVGRRWYGDFPFRNDRNLGVPRSIYRLNRELTLRPRVEAVRFDGGVLRIEGYAFIGGIGAPTRGSQKVSVAALRPGRLASLRLKFLAPRFKTVKVHRPDVNSAVAQSWCDAQWSGFVATLDPRKLRGRGDGLWDIYVTVSAPGVKRRRARFLLGGARPVRTVDAVAGGALVHVRPTETWGLAIERTRRWATITRARVRAAQLELAGDLATSPGTALRIPASQGSTKLEYPLAVESGRFTARIPLGDLEGRKAEQQELYAIDGDARIRMRVAEDVAEGPWPLGERELAVSRDRQGDGWLALRAPRPLVTLARWSGDGVLELRGRVVAPGPRWELFVRSRALLEEYPVSLERHAEDGSIEARFTPAAIPSLAGALPLREGSWELWARPGGGGEEVPVAVTQLLYDSLPLETEVNHKQFLLGATAEQEAVLFARRDLDDDERGRFHQRRLRSAVYASGREEQLREAVVFVSFNGRQYSDSPRAIHEELVRREAPLEHFWVVRDGMCQVPSTAGVLRQGSREHYQVLSRARYVVSNDHFPEWFVRRPDQTVVQTWHGTPLKRLGFDVPEVARASRRLRRRWDALVGNWQYVLSPNPFSTPILRRAYDVTGEILETGYPRNDVLAGSDREAAAAELRRRLGIPLDARVVLYAPTYRDHVIDRQGRYRLDLHLDLERLHAALGDETVVLFRKHHYVVDPVPAAANGFVRDVSAYPDGTELLLAADVLVTDYSSMMFDFANTGRPMLFFTYDLDLYKDEIRGFYFDFADRAPGPLLQTSDEVAEALRDIEGVRAQYAGAYEEFAATFCELDDGRAAARVVDRLFELGSPAATR